MEPKVISEVENDLREAALEVSVEMVHMIDLWSYVDMLRKWRFETSGDPMFQGPMGRYFSFIMEQKKFLLSQDEQVTFSKMVGWDV